MLYCSCASQLTLPYRGRWRREKNWQALHAALHALCLPSLLPCTFCLCPFTVNENFNSLPPSAKTLYLLTKTSEKLLLFYYTDLLPSTLWRLWERGKPPFLHTAHFGTDPNLCLCSLFPLMQCVPAFPLGTFLPVWRGRLGEVDSSFTLAFSLHV